MRRPRILSLVLLAAAGQLAGARAALLEAGYRQMYNLEFEKAHASFNEWERLHPDDPMGPVSNAAAYLFAEFDRLHILQSEFFVDDDTFLNHRGRKPDPALKRNFESALARSQQLADPILAHAPQDENALFATVLRYGLHSDYLALIEKRYLASVGEMKTGRQIAERLLASHPECYDAHLAVGVENYILSLKPAPVRWLLRLGGARTNRELGVKKLRLTAEKGCYLQPFARLLLAVAALRSKEPDRARGLLRDLATEFPHNRLYKEELARLK